MVASGTIPLLQTGLGWSFDFSDSFLPARAQGGAMDQLMEIADKRRAERFPMALPVSVKLETPRAEATVKTRDVSSSGVFLNLNLPIEVGSSLEFVLTLPAEITKGQAVQVKCRGKIVRVEQTSPEGEVLGAAATIERYEFVREG